MHYRCSLCLGSFVALLSAPAHAATLELSACAAEPLAALGSTEQLRRRIELPRGPLPRIDDVEGWRILERYRAGRRLKNTREAAGLDDYQVGIEQLHARFPHDERLTTASCEASYALAIEYLVAGDRDRARDLFTYVDGPGCDLEDELLVSFSAAASRAEIEALGLRADLETALALARGTYEYGVSRSGPSVSAQCDYARLEMIAGLVALRQDEPDHALVRLEHARRLVRGLPGMTEATTGASALSAAHAIRRGDYALAVQRLTWATDQPGGEAFLADLVVASCLLAGQLHQQAKTRDALELFERALEIERRQGFSPPLAAEGLARVGFDYANRLQRANELAEVRELYRRLSTQLPALEPELTHRLSLLEGLEERLMVMNATHSYWELPAIDAEAYLDTDADGFFDHAVYSSRDVHEFAAIAELTNHPAPPSRLDTEDHYYRDLDGDGRFDEKGWLSDGRLQYAQIDTNDDGSPDAQLDCAGGPCQRTMLSGRVALIIQRGIVGESSDLFSDTDAYVVIDYRPYNWHRGSARLETSTKYDTNYPEWYEGWVLDYHYRDQVDLTLRDWDRFTPDDDIGHFEFDTLPEAGLYRLHGGRAALQIDVVPTGLPHGYRIAADFGRALSTRPTTPWPHDLVAGAQAAHLQAEVTRFITKQLVAAAATRELSFIPGLVIGQLLDSLVLEPALTDKWMDGR
jgi:hypothetical protein